MTFEVLLPLLFMLLHGEVASGGRVTRNTSEHGTISPRIVAQWADIIKALLAACFASPHFVQCPPPLFLKRDRVVVADSRLAS
jgi:hypothetical protein